MTKTHASSSYRPEQSCKFLSHANPWLTYFFFKIFFRVFESMRLGEIKREKKLWYLILLVEKDLFFEMLNQKK